MKKITRQPARHTTPKESATRKRVDLILNNLGWKTDEQSPDCTVFTERAKTVEQQRALGRHEPDYLLYKSGTDTPIAVIETKRDGQSMAKALSQAVVRYAKPLDIEIVFVADGSIVEAHHVSTETHLRADGDIITSLLSEKDLLRFVTEGAGIWTPETVQHTRVELIRVFKSANDLLRKEGLREGIERFTEFSNLLFLKLISEIEQERERQGEHRILEARYCWESFSLKSAPEMLDYINDTILPRLVGKYNHSGDVFQRELLIKTPETLKQIIDSLSKLTLLNADSDVKGDAFEYFLKNSVSVGNDLGEYFTPRHIVKLMTDLIDPVFGEKIYDPACGTGGFLIQAFRHVQAKVRATPESKRVLQEETVYGRELTGTAKIAKMNMILIGDGHANVQQTDSLKLPVMEEYQVVLSNFPFSQKTDYASLYGLDGKSQNANPIFLKHIIDAAAPGARIAVVVPEGLLFDETAQLAKVRQILTDTCNIEAVISLHNFVFRPYTGQPTSILVFSKTGATKRVWFFDVQEDGFEKRNSKRGRMPSAKSDLPLLRQLWEDKSDSHLSFSVDADTIRQHGYRLTIDEYRANSAQATWVPLGGKDGLCDIVIGGTPPSRNHAHYNGRHAWVTITDITTCDGLPITKTAKMITDSGIASCSVKPIKKGTCLLSFKLSPGKTAIAGVDLFTNEAVAALVPRDGRVLPEYLYYVLPRLNYRPYGRRATKGITLKKESVAAVRVPVPSIPVQKRIIKAMSKQESEIAAHRARIAKAVLTADEVVATTLGIHRPADVE